MFDARAHVFVSGQVQGVFFRQSTREKARISGVTGWVRNLPDGRVEAVFEGEQNAVNSLIDYCRKGPVGAMITDVDIKFEKFTGEFKNFKIVY
jgi:acylphosphatase